MNSESTAWSTLLCPQSELLIFNHFKAFGATHAKSIIEFFYFFIFFKSVTKSTARNLIMASFTALLICKCIAAISPWVYSDRTQALLYAHTGSCRPCCHWFQHFSPLFKCKFRLRRDLLFCFMQSSAVLQRAPAPFTSNSISLLIYSYWQVCLHTLQHQITSHAISLTTLWPEYLAEVSASSLNLPSTLLPNSSICWWKRDLSCIVFTLS